MARMTDDDHRSLPGGLERVFQLGFRAVRARAGRADAAFLQLPHLLLQLFHAFRRHLHHQRFGVGGVAVDALGRGHQHQLFRMDEVCNHRRRFVVIHALYHLVAVAAADG